MVVDIFVYSFVKLLAIGQPEAELTVTHIVTKSKKYVLHDTMEY